MSNFPALYRRLRLYLGLPCLVVIWITAIFYAAFAFFYLTLKGILVLFPSLDFSVVAGAAHETCWISTQNFYTAFSRSSIDFSGVLNVIISTSRFLKTSQFMFFLCSIGGQKYLNTLDLRSIITGKKQVFAVT